MAKERSVIPARRSPEQSEPLFFRAIVSPCTGCKKGAIPISVNEDDISSGGKTSGIKGDWPCPKRILYAQKLNAFNRTLSGLNDASANKLWRHPIYNEQYLLENPCWASGNYLGTNLNNESSEFALKYNYFFVATFYDNVENGWNPNFDTEKIRCRGPFLCASPEKLLNWHGKINQWRTVLCFSQYYMMDGVQFYGYLVEATAWKTHQAIARKIDHNLTATVSGAK